MGVGPIETLRAHGYDKGLQEMMHSTAIHFDDGFKRNGFAWVANCWELSLDIDTKGLTKWLQEIRNRWPEVKFITQGEFGLLWRSEYKENNFDYRFYEKGSGIGGSDADKEIYWYMNKSFRLAILNQLNTQKDQIIDINQKQTRKQDAPISKNQLSEEQKALILKEGINLGF